MPEVVVTPDQAPLDLVSPDLGPPRPFLVTSTGWGGIAKGVAVDSKGNIFVTGFVSGTGTFGNKTYSAGWWDLFVAKLNYQGNVDWIVTGGGAEHEEGKSIAVDSAGNAYVTGFFKGVAKFGTITMTSAAKSTYDYDAYVAKIDGNGKFRWVTMEPSVKYSSEGNDVYTLANGTTYVVGSFDGQILKLDSNGKHLWPSKGGSATQSAGSAITLDSPGNIYVTGKMNDTGETFGSFSLKPPKGKLTYGYVYKMSPAGKYLWARLYELQTPEDISVTPKGDVNIALRFMSSVTLGGKTYTAYGPSSSNDDSIVLQLDNVGKLKWVNQIGGKAQAGILATDVDSKNNLYLFGSLADGAVFGSTTLSISVSMIALKMDATGQYITSKQGPNTLTAYSRCEDGRLVNTGGFVCAGWDKIAGMVIWRVLKM
jgi:hypothetical protein